ncbi:MAG: chaperone modulator CbpM [Methylohalobius sp.]|nr:chaperone modulator CbpM [Methylohalobius sp.]
MAENEVLSGTILDERFRLTLMEVCQICEVSADRIVELVSEGVIEVEGNEPAAWCFDAVTFQRLRIALRLERDLGLNPAGAALVLDLLEELHRLRGK